MDGIIIERPRWEITSIRLLKNHAYLGSLFEELIRDRLKPGV